jgi:hypothetical protein
MSWVPGPPQVVVRHLLAEAIREALTVKEPIGDAAITYNVVEASTGWRPQSTGSPRSWPTPTA